MSDPGEIWAYIVQAKLAQLGLLEEERDFLLQEKNTLVDRLGNLEARQGSFQERERHAKNRGVITVHIFSLNTEVKNAYDKGAACKRRCTYPRLYCSTCGFSPTVPLTETLSTKYCTSHVLLFVARFPVSS